MLAMIRLLGMSFFMSNPYLLLETPTHTKTLTVHNISEKDIHKMHTKHKQVFSLVFIAFSECFECFVVHVADIQGPLIGYQGVSTQTVYE